MKISSGLQNRINELRFKPSIDWKYFTSQNFALLLIIIACNLQSNGYSSLWEPVVYIIFSTVYLFIFINYLIVAWACASLLIGPPLNKIKQERYDVALLVMIFNRSLWIDFLSLIFRAIFTILTITSNNQRIAYAFLLLWIMNYLLILQCKFDLTRRFK